MELPSLIFVCGTAVYVTLAALVDIRQHRVPNYLTIPALLLGLGYHALSPTGWGLGVSVAGFAVGFGLLLLPWLFGGGGMGDVKLLAALGAWLGPKLMLVAFALSVLSAAVMALAALTWIIATDGFSRAQRDYIGSGAAVAASGSSTSMTRRKQRILPFAVPVALSVWSMLAWMVLQGTL